MIVIVMHHYNLDLQAAVDWVGEFYFQQTRLFLLLKDNLPTWEEPLNSIVARYVEGLGNWVTANEHWSFETQRYFGTKGLDIWNHRVVDLLPQTHGIAQVD